MRLFGRHGHYWCLEHEQVEPRKGCPSKSRLGPYRDREEAEAALDRVRYRNSEWNAEDRRWES